MILKMATDAAKTIKSGDSTITAAIREFWNQDIQRRIYDRVLSRNLSGAVRIIQAYGQGVDNTYRWTKSKGITTTASDRYDITTSQLELKQVEYELEEKNVSAEPFGGYVSQKLDILRDQQGFVMPDIMDSLADDMAIKEDTKFLAVLESGKTEKYAAADNVDLNLVELKKGGVTPQEEANLETLYYLMSPGTVDLFADELRPANTTGDNSFLRRNAVGSLWGVDVVKTNKVADGVVYYLARDAVRMFEREPYTMNMRRDNISDYFVKFAIQARFGFAVDRDKGIYKSTFVADSLTA